MAILQSHFNPAFSRSTLLQGAFQASRANRCIHRGSRSPPKLTEKAPSHLHNRHQWSSIGTSLPPSKWKCLASNILVVTSTSILFFHQILEKAQFWKLAKTARYDTLNSHYLRQYCHFIFRYAKRLDFTHEKRITPQISYPTQLTRKTINETTVTSTRPKIFKYENSRQRYHYNSFNFHFDQNIPKITRKMSNLMIWVTQKNTRVNNPILLG